MVAYPRFGQDAPPPIMPAEPVDAALLLFPVITGDDVLQWHTEDSFRLAVASTPASLVARVPRGSFEGYVRTRDRFLTENEASDVRCAFGRSSTARMSLPLPCRMALSYSKERTAAGIVEDLLDELRVSAARIGINVVSDVRCYGASATRRLWCEGVAERLR
jgi:hypothetical protein